MPPPKYQQIAQELRDAVIDGEYPPGDKLPAIPQLMVRYGVARETVRRAIAVLTNEGVVTPHSGVGTVVRDTGRINRHSGPIPSSAARLDELSVMISRLSEVATLNKGALTWAEVHEEFAVRRAELAGQ
jgi:DNA-binding GntR family transcriptional regulator